MKQYIIAISIILLLASCSSDKKENVVETKPATVNYPLATVEKGGVATVIKLPGQLAAYQEVSIFPKVNGYVKNVLVDIGSKVSQGNLLMTLEAQELEEAALQAKERFARSRADFAIDKERFLRLEEAAQTAGAVSPLDLSTIKAKMVADSALCNAEKANWQMQQTMLGYLRVTAPFTGVITERNVHPGALVSASAKDKPMLELKQVAHLRLQVDIPEAIAANLKDKDTVSFYVSAFPGKKMNGFISRKADNITAEFRSEKMEIDVMNDDGLLSPGMFADVILKSKGNMDALYVPKSAVVTSTERKYVMLVKDSTRTKVDVSTGNETSSKIEIYGNLKVGDRVIANANDEIKEGK